MDYTIYSMLLYYVINIVKFGLILLGILEFTLKKNKWVYLVILMPVFFMTILSCGRMENSMAIMETVMPVLIITAVSFVLQGKIIKRVSYSILVYICIIFFDLCITGIVSLLLNTTMDEIAGFGILNILCHIISILIFSFIVLFKKKRNKSFDTNHITRYIYLLLFIGACTGVFLVAGLMITNNPGTGDNLRKIVLIAIIIVCTANLSACIMLVFLTKSRDTYKVLSQINQEVIESQRRYYLLAQEKQQEIRSLRHDMINHFSCIDALLKSNKQTELEEYISQLIGRAQAFDQLFDTGNDIVNAILNDAESRYKKDGIKIRLTGMFPEELHISSTDLCVIFANAISNAVEAIQKIDRNVDEPSEIHVRIGSYKEDLFIDISNPAAQKADIVHGRLVTTKREKTLHGFGTVNMKQRVEKYHGTIEFVSEDKMFHVHIHMINR